LAEAVAALLDDPALAMSIGTTARERTLSKRGAVSRVAMEIRKAAARGIPDPMRGLPARAVLTPLSWIWRASHRANLSRPPREFSTRVISVGGLSMGGAGKTPVVAHLAERISAAGKLPAILTRGYRRKSSQT